MNAMMSTKKLDKRGATNSMSSATMPVATNNNAHIMSNETVLSGIEILKHSAKLMKYSNVGGLKSVCETNLNCSDQLEDNCLNKPAAMQSAEKPVSTSKGHLTFTGYRIEPSHGQKIAGPEQVKMLKNNENIFINMRKVKINGDSSSNSSKIPSASPKSAIIRKVTIIDPKKLQECGLDRKLAQAIAATKINEANQVKPNVSSTEPGSLSALKVSKTHPLLSFPLPKTTGAITSKDKLQQKVRTNLTIGEASANTASGKNMESEVQNTSSEFVGQLTNRNDRLAYTKSLLNQKLHAKFNKLLISSSGGQQEMSLKDTANEISPESGLDKSKVVSETLNSMESSKSILDPATKIVTEKSKVAIASPKSIETPNQILRAPSTSTTNCDPSSVNAFEKVPEKIVVDGEQKTVAEPETRLCIIETKSMTPGESCKPVKSKSIDTVIETDHEPCRNVKQDHPSDKQNSKLIKHRAKKIPNLSAVNRKSKTTSKGVIDEKLTVTNSTRDKEKIPVQKASANPLTKSTSNLCHFENPVTTRTGANTEITSSTSVAIATTTGKVSTPVVPVVTTQGPPEVRSIGTNCTLTAIAPSSLIVLENKVLSGRDKIDVTHLSLAGADNKSHSQSTPLITEDTPVLLTLTDISFVPKGTMDNRNVMCITLPSEQTLAGSSPQEAIISTEEKLTFKQFYRQLRKKYDKARIRNRQRMRLMRKQKRRCRQFPRKKFQTSQHLNRTGVDIVCELNLSLKKLTPDEEGLEQLSRVSTNSRKQEAKMLLEQLFGSSFATSSIETEKRSLADNDLKTVSLPSGDRELDSSSHKDGCDLAVGGTVEVSQSPSRKRSAQESVTTFNSVIEVTKLQEVNSSEEIVAPVVAIKDGVDMKNNIIVESTTTQDLPLDVTNINLRQESNSAKSSSVKSGSLSDSDDSFYGFDSELPLANSMEKVVEAPSYEGIASYEVVSVEDDAKSSNQAQQSIPLKKRWELKHRQHSNTAPMEITSSEVRTDDGAYSDPLDLPSSQPLKSLKGCLNESDNYDCYDYDDVIDNSNCSLSDHDNSIVLPPEDSETLTTERTGITNAIKIDEPTQGVGIKRKVTSMTPPSTSKRKNLEIPDENEIIDVKSMAPLTVNNSTSSAVKPDELPQYLIKQKKSLETSREDSSASASSIIDAVPKKFTKLVEKQSTPRRSKKEKSTPKQTKIDEKIQYKAVDDDLTPCPTVLPSSSPISSKFGRKSTIKMTPTTVPQSTPKVSRNIEEVEDTVDHSYRLYQSLPEVTKIMSEAPVVVLEKKKRGRKPLHQSIDGSPEPSSDFNPRLLLVRNRSQLDTDEVLTETTENPISDGHHHQCGLCLAYVTGKDWFAHIGTHYGVGWIVGETPIDVTKRHVVLGAIRNYFKLLKSKSVLCRMCAHSYRSALGLLLHIETCGDVQLRVNCIFCQNSYTKLSYSVHLRTCSKRIENRDQDSIVRVENVEPTEILFHNSGRAKRASVVKAEIKFKQIDLNVDDSDTDTDRTQKLEQFCKKHIEMCIEQDTDTGQFKCPHGDCPFTAADVPAVVEHSHSCSMPKPEKYACRICKIKIIFKTEEEAIAHIKLSHQRKLKLNGSNSDCYDITGDGQSSSDSNSDTFLASEPTKRVKKCKPKPKPMNLNTVLPKRLHNIREFALNSWREFCATNYTNTSLFPFAKPDYQMSMNYSIPEATSMEFTFIKNHQLMRKFGVPREDLQMSQLKCYETFKADNDYINFAGGPVVQTVWIPLPSNVQEQYLLVVHRNEHNEYVPFLNPIKKLSTILLYKLDFDDNFQPKNFKLYYLVSVPDAPIHFVACLPSGGYDPHMNRLALIAVGTVSRDVKIYALPIEIDVDDSHDTNSDSNPNVMKPPILTIAPTMVLEWNTDPKDSSFEYLSGNQCVHICWSETNSHRYIFAGFSLGYVGVWDIADTDRNINRIVDDNGLLHFHPMQVINRREPYIYCMGLHYDTHGVRWLAVSSNSRSPTIYDFKNMCKPMVLRNDFSRSVGCHFDWPPIWEQMIVTHEENGLLGTFGITVHNPLNILYTTFCLDTTIEVASRVHYNPYQHVIASSFLNGDILLYDVGESFLDETLVPKLSKCISMMNLTSLNGEPLPGHTAAQKEDWDIDEVNYKERYGLVFSSFTQYRNAHKDANRKVPFPVIPYMQVNSLHINLNEAMNASKLIAVGHENGLVRILYFDRDIHLK